VKKLFMHTVMSDQICTACGKPIKLRHVFNKTVERLCYKCYAEFEARRGHFIHPRYKPASDMRELEPKKEATNC
jgi:RNA polymerase-binding transcription factor DksA